MNATTNKATAGDAGPDDAERLTTHTPGPWRYVWPCVYSTNKATRYLEVALISPARSFEDEANGRLIAAAPELLRCAVMALEELQEAARVNPLAPIAFRALQAAITAATSASASDTTTIEHPGA